MQDAYANLGQRIVTAARLAVAMHMQEVALEKMNSRGQRVMVGGADRSAAVKEDRLPADWLSASAGGYAEGGAE